MQSNSFTANPLLTRQLADHLPIFAELESRPEYDHLLASSLLAQFSIFQTIQATSDVILSCIRKMLSFVEYKIIPANTAIYQEGTQSSDLYFILQGNINTFIQKTPLEIKAEVDEEIAGESGPFIPKHINPRKITSLNITNVRTLRKLYEEANQRIKNLHNPPSKKQEANNRLRFTSGVDDDLLLRRKRSGSRPRKGSVLIDNNSMSKQDYGVALELQQLKRFSGLIFAGFGSENRPIGERKLSSQPTLINLQQQGEEAASDTAAVLEDIKRLLSIELKEAMTALFKTFRSHKYFAGDHILFKFYGEYEAGTCLGPTGSTKITDPVDHTAICMSDTHVLVCPFKDFYSCFEELLFEKDQKNALFDASLKGIALPSKLNYFAKHFEKRIYGLNEVLFTEGATPDGLYLINKGEVELHKNTPEWGGFSPSHNKTFDRITEQYIYKKNSVPFHMIKLGSGQFFGEEVLNDESSRRNTAVALSSHTEVYFLELARLNHLRDSCSKILNYLKAQFHQKSDVRDTRLRNVVETALSKEAAENYKPLGKCESLREMEKYFKQKVYVSTFDYDDRRDGILSYELGKIRAIRARIENAKKVKAPDYLIKMRQKKEADKKKRLQKAASSVDGNQTQRSDISELEFLNTLEQKNIGNIRTLKTMKYIVKQKKVQILREGSRHHLDAHEASITRGETENMATSKDSILYFGDASPIPGNLIKESAMPTQTFLDEDETNQSTYRKITFITDQDQVKEKPTMNKSLLLAEAREMATEASSLMKKAKSVLKVRENLMPYMDRSGYMKTDRMLTDISKDNKGEDLMKYIEGFKTERSKENIGDETVRSRISANKNPEMKAKPEGAKRAMLYNEISAIATRKGSIDQVKLNKSHSSSLIVKKEKETSVTEDKNVEKLAHGLQNVKRMFARLRKRQQDFVQQGNLNKSQMNSLNLCKNGPIEDYTSRRSNNSDSIKKIQLIRLKGVIHSARKSAA